MGPATSREAVASRQREERGDPSQIGTFSLLNHLFLNYFFYFLFSAACHNFLLFLFISQFFSYFLFSLFFRIFLLLFIIFHS